MTIDEVRDMCFEIAEKRGVCISGIPIIENNRLRTTLGRVKYTWLNQAEETVRVTSIEFNTKHLSYSTSEAVIDTIKHEMAHAIAALETGKRQGHNALFRQICREIGTDDFRRFTKHDVMTQMPFTEEVKKPVKSRPFKYELICSCCGHSNGKRKVRSKVIDHPEMYLSGCCHAELEVIEL